MYIAIPIKFRIKNIRNIILCLLICIVVRRKNHFYLFNDVFCNYHCPMKAQLPDKKKIYIIKIVAHICIYSV